MNIAEPRPAARVNLSLRMASLTAGALIALLLACSCVAPIAAHASGGGKVSSTATAKSGGGEGGGVTDLENAAKNAGKTGENVAISLIGLALAIAAIVLTFRRDFKEAAGVVLIGGIAIFLAKGVGVKVLEETVKSLFPGA